MKKNMLTSIILLLLAIHSLGITQQKSAKSQNNLYAYVASIPSESHSGGMITKIDLNNFNVVNQKVFTPDSFTTGAPLVLEIDTVNQYKCLLVSMIDNAYPIYKIDIKSLKSSCFADTKWDGDPYEAPYYTSIKVSPTGKVFYTHLNGKTVEIDIGSLQIIRTVPDFQLGHLGTGDVFILPDGKTAISYEPFACGELKIIDLQNNKMLRNIRYDCQNIDDSTYLAILNDSLRFLTDGKARIAPQGNSIYSTDRPYYVYIHTNIDVETNMTISEDIKIFDTATSEIIDSIPFSIEFRSKNNLEKLIEIDSFFKKFADLADKNGFIPPRRGNREISVTPDGKYIFWSVTGSYDLSYVIIIDTKTKEVVKRIPIGGGHITNVVFGYE